MDKKWKKMQMNQNSVFKGKAYPWKTFFFNPVIFKNIIFFFLKQKQNLQSNTTTFVDCWGYWSLLVQEVLQIQIIELFTRFFIFISSQEPSLLIILLIVN